MMMIGRVFLVLTLTIVNAVPPGSVTTPMIVGPEALNRVGGNGLTSAASMQGAALLGTIFNPAELEAYGYVHSYIHNIFNYTPYAYIHITQIAERWLLLSA